jgi:hypothetical protein
MLSTCEVQSPAPKEEKRRKEKMKERRKEKGKNEGRKEEMRREEKKKRCLFHTVLEIHQHGTGEDLLVHCIMVAGTKCKSDNMARQQAREPGRSQSCCSIAAHSWGT